MFVLYLKIGVFLSYDSQGKRGETLKGRQGRGSWCILLIPAPERWKKKFKVILAYR